MDKKEIIRGYISAHLRRSLKGVIGVRMDKDWTISDVLEEAISDWLAKPENQALIKLHNLDLSANQSIDDP